MRRGERVSDDDQHVWTCMILRPLLELHTRATIPFCADVLCARVAGGPYAHFLVVGTRSMRAYECNWVRAVADWVEGEVRFVHHVHRVSLYSADSLDMKAAPLSVSVALPP